MSKIKIKNFGPIKEGFDPDVDDGFMDIKKVTVFIGDQGSGKSSVAKLISILTWMEKAINRGEINIKGINFNRFKQLCTYQRVENYFSPNTEIEYLGDAYSIKIITNQPPGIQEIQQGSYVVPKIMYVPAERNFLSTIKSAYDVTGLPETLVTFAEELKRAQIELNGNKLDLPIRDYAYEYDEFLNIAHVLGSGYKINILEASSGLQSLIPLYIVSKNLSSSIAKADDYDNANISVNQRIRRNDEIARITLDVMMPENEKKERINKIYARFHNKCFINIVEEPEQNLYPGSQWHVLKSLLELNIAKGNKLIMTTHSPYIINYLTLAVKGYIVSKKIEASNKQEELNERLNEIVSIKSVVNPDDLAIYELSDDGKIIKLADYKGLPSDENYLNEKLAESNDLFSQLLDIEDLCQ